MRIVYVALKPLQVGDAIRQPGDLVPEAINWAFLPAYVADGKVFPVLVATLPEEVQETLLAWEESVNPVSSRPGKIVLGEEPDTEPLFEDPGPEQPETDQTPTEAPAPKPRSQKASR